MMKFLKGDDVLVRLPGVGLVVPAIIVSVSSKPGSDYLVRFEQGQEHKIAEKNIKPATGKPSPSSRRGRRASPARQRSPARRPKNSPSPARRRSPSRRSPARAVKEVPATEKLEDAPRSYLRSRKPISELHTSMREPSPLYTTFSSSDISFDFFNGSSRGGGTEEVSSSKQEEGVCRVLHMKPGYEHQVAIGDKIITEPVIVRRLPAPTEFGGRIGTLLLMLVFPGSVLAIHALCNRSSCSWTLTPATLLKYQRLDTYLDAQAAVMYLVFISLSTLVSVIPVGGHRVSCVPGKHAKREYYMNGTFTLVLLLLLAAWLEWSGVPMSSAVCAKYVPLCVCALMTGLVLSALVYACSHRAPLSHLNTHALAGRFPYDYYMGRETNPRLLGVDIKLVWFRTCLIGTTLVCLAFLVVGIREEISIRYPEPLESVMTHSMALDVILHPTHELVTLVTAVLFTVIYTVDSLVFEWAMVTTFEFVSEGFGYMLCVGYAAYPFMTSSVVKFVAEHAVTMDFSKLAIAWVAYLLSFIVYRLSNLQKHKFRLNPYDPSLAHLESIPTSQGKKLLVSGFWGVVRRPNYAGDIALHLCLYSLAPCVPAAVTVMASVMFILYRIRRDGVRCQDKYGAAWDRYCQQVPYNLVPRVY